MHSVLAIVLVYSVVVVLCFFRLNNKLSFAVWNKHLFVYEMATAFSFTLLDNALDVVSRNSSLVCLLTSNRFVTVSKRIIRRCDCSKKIFIPYSQIPHSLLPVRTVYCTYSRYFFCCDVWKVLWNAPQRNTQLRWMKIIVRPIPICNYWKYCRCAAVHYLQFSS